MSLFERIHCNVWFRIRMTQAYLAWHRMEFMEARELEAQARRYEDALRKYHFQKRWT